MSRPLNPLMKEEKCKLEDLSVAEQLVDKNDFMCTLDLKNQFFHVQLNSDYKKYFGFKLPNDSGLHEYYQFNVMAYIRVQTRRKYCSSFIKTSKTILTSLGNIVMLKRNLIKF